MKHFDWGVKGDAGSLIDSPRLCLVFLPQQPARSVGEEFCITQPDR